MSKKNNPNSRTVRMLDGNTPFAVREAYNQLRTNLMYTSTEQNSCPVYAITSAEAGEGKSTVISNLAIAFSQANKKVLLIDADMRRPVQCQNFGLDKKRTGLSELLSGISAYDASLLANPLPSLYVLTSGVIPPNPSELMLGGKLEELITMWREEFDVIFIDLPPVGVVSDPLSVAKLADGYVIVVMANKTDGRRLSDAIGTLEKIGARVLGVVMAGSNPKGNSSYNNKHNYSKDYTY